MNDGTGKSERELGESGAPRRVEPTPDVRTGGRRRYEPPRVERRIPVAANTMQTTSGTETFFPE